MDLAAVREARRGDLLACAVTAARNALGLLHDAELLAQYGARARAYSLAAFAVEECGKAFSLCALLVLPGKRIEQAPIGRMLEWHQLKQVGGLLMGVMTLEEPGAAVRLAAMPRARAQRLMQSLAVRADEADRLKRRGMYVDMDSSGRIREPAEITEAETADELQLARQAADSAELLLGPQVQARLADPPAELTTLAEALVDALTQAGRARTPDAAVEVMLEAVTELQTLHPPVQ